MPRRDHHRQQPPDPTTPQEVLVGDEPVAHEAETAIDLLARANRALEHAHDVLAVADHRRAHDRGAGRTPRDDPARAIDVPDRLQQRRDLAARHQRIDDARLRASGEVDATRAAHQLDPLRILDFARHIDTGQQRRDGHVLGHCAVSAQVGNDARGRALRIPGGRCEHDVSCSRAAGELHEARPHGIVIGLERPANHDCITGGSRCRHCRPRVTAMGGPGPASQRRRQGSQRKGKSPWKPYRHPLPLRSLRSVAL